MIYGNVFCEALTENSLFDYSNPRNSDGLFTPYIELRKKLLGFGIELNTPDLNIGKSVAVEVHMDSRPLIINDTIKYLIAVENPLINRLNGNVEYLNKFHRVFSWNDAALALPKAVRIFIANDLSMLNTPSFSNRNIFSCLISSNKVAPWFGDNDLYAERINVVRWYEKHAPSFFHLYGRGWGKPSPVFSRTDKFFRRIIRIRTQLFGYQPFPSWCGEVKSKAGILSATKFSYCYENVSDLPNYITEKIFDSFLSGCVPIYWGASNVLDYIPADCFIDRRKFKDTAEVQNYLLSITPEQYAQYQINIANFLAGEKGYLFGIENFVATVASTIASDLTQGH